MYTRVNKPRKARTPSYIRPKGRSASMGTVYSDAVFSGFTGLNTKFSNVELDDTESPDCMNVEFDSVGAITKRNGYTLVVNEASKIVSVLPFFTSSLNKLLLTFGTSIVQYDPIANTSTTVTSTLTGNGVRFSSAMDTVHNKIYMANGNATDGLMSWDGTTFTKNIATSGGETPQGQFVVWYKNRLYVSGDPANPNRIYVSDQGDPTSWPLANFEDIDDDFGGITGMAQFGDSIVVFKQFAMFIIKGSDPSNYIVTNAYSGGKGTMCHWSIVNVPGALMFLAHDGVYEFSGKKLNPLSLKLDISVWDQTYLQNVTAFAYDYKYWLSVPEGTTQSTNNRTYVYNYQYGWWTRHSFGMNASGLFYGNTELPTPYFSDTSGNLFQADNGGSDNSASIDAYFWTKAFDFGAQAHFKMFKRLFVSAEAEPGNYGLNVEYDQDFGKNTRTAFMPLGYPNPTTWGNFSWGEANWGGNGDVTNYTTTVPGLCQYLAFKLEGNGVNAPFRILEVMTQYTVMSRVT